MNSEASSQSSYVWQPAAVATDAYTAANKLNQYPSWTPQGSSLQSFTYDLNGNLTGGTIAGAAWTYAYDPENRLITANKTSGGTVAATYAYDPLGRRNHKSGTGVTETYFLDDGTDEIAEYDSTGTPVNRFIPGPLIDEPAAQIIVSGSHRRFFLADHHGSTVAMANASGNQVEGPYVYDTYGNGAPTTGTPYKYVGMRLDPETGLYFDRARYYSSALGRFMQIDPVGYTADLNLYTYGSNDPANELDLLGETSVCVIEAGKTVCDSSGPSSKPRTRVSLSGLSRGLSFVGAVIRANPIVIVLTVVFTPTAAGETCTGAPTVGCGLTTTIAAQAVDGEIADIEKTDTATDSKGQREVDVSGKGRNPDADIEAIANAGGGIVQDKGNGVKVVNLPGGGTATKYPTSKSFGRPSIKIIRPGTKAIHIRY